MENEKLLIENANLKEQIKELEKEKFNASNTNKIIVGKGLKIFFGKNLSKSIKNLVVEAYKGKVKAETLGDAITYSFQRFVRVGFTVLLIALLPALFTFWQAILLKHQNKKIDIQNKLIESDRRGNTFFLLGEVMTELNIELRDTSNHEKRLSSSLISQIISISRIMRPYQYLKPNGDFSSFLSLERGQLLSILATSEIHHSDLSKIFSDGNFQFSKIEKLKLTIPISGIDLSNSEIDELSLMGTEEESEMGANIILDNTAIKNLKTQFINKSIGLSFKNSTIKKFFGWRCIGLALNMDNTKFETLHLSHIEDVSEIYLKDIKVLDLSDVNIDTIKIHACNQLNLNNLSVRHGFINNVNSLKVSRKLRINNKPKSMYGGCGTPVFNGTIEYDDDLSNFKINGTDNARIEIDEVNFDQQMGKDSFLFNNNFVYFFDEDEMCRDSSFQINYFINNTIIDSISLCDPSQSYYRLEQY